MRTNYYLKTNIPSAPGYPENIIKLHIGKSSHGWAFALRVYPELNITTYNDWRFLFEHNEIEDEDGVPVFVGDMMDIIEDRSWPGGLHRAEIGNRCLGHGLTWDYIVGEFS